MCTSPFAYICHGLSVCHWAFKKLGSVGFFTSPAGLAHGAGPAGNSRMTTAVSFPAGPSVSRRAFPAACAGPLCLVTRRASSAVAVIANHLQIEII